VDDNVTASPAVVAPSNTQLVMPNIRIVEVANDAEPPQLATQIPNPTLVSVVAMVCAVDGAPVNLATLLSAVTLTELLMLTDKRVVVPLEVTVQLAMDVVEQLISPLNGNQLAITPVEKYACPALPDEGSGGKTFLRLLICV
jgi:hypothetical protein